jgi:immune inhibitor A
MQADGRNDLEFGRNRGDVGDPYPGSANNTHLDETSNPSSIDTLGRPTTVSVSEITVSDGVVRCEASV